MKKVNFKFSSPFILLANYIISSIIHNVKNIEILWKLHYLDYYHLSYYLLVYLCLYMLIENYILNIK
jgi:hypothetical protein